MADSNTADLGKGKRITGGDRSTLADDLRKRYDGGESIRSLAESTKRSYGFVHRLLSESGATLRSRGGANRKVRRRDSGAHRHGWVRTQQDGAVLTVTLDRPDQLNAQTPTTWATLAADRRVAGRRRAGGRRPRRGSLVLRRAWTAACSAPSPASTAASATWAGAPPPRPRTRIRGLPGRLPLAAPPGHRLDRGGAGPRASAPASSSRSPATCGSSPTTPSCGWPRRRSASCPT